MTQRFGKYQLLKQLAMGGMAEIWLARQQGGHGFEKLVVVKRILPHLAKNREFVEMFLDEARLSVQLAHPGVAQIFDLGEADGSFFIAMEYIHGENLAVIARRHQKRIAPGLPSHVAAHLAARTAEALHHAHTRTDMRGRALEIVHRDVSPQNVLLGYDGVVKVVDFGIAKARSRVTHTRTGVLKGKYSYMSPEQCRGQELDGRSDQFALGIMFWELLTGRRLFKHESELMILQAICSEPTPSPREYVPDLDPALEAIVLRSLARDREDRFPDCNALQVALDGWIHRAAQPVLASDLGDLMRSLFPDRIDAWGQIIEDAEKEGSFGSEIFAGRSQLFEPNTPTPSRPGSVAGDDEHTPVEGGTRRARPAEPTSGGRVARSPASGVAQTALPGGSRLTPRAERPIAAPDPKEISERYAAMPEVAPPLAANDPRPKRRASGIFPAVELTPAPATKEPEASPAAAAPPPPEHGDERTPTGARPPRGPSGAEEARGSRRRAGGSGALRRVLTVLLTVALVVGTIAVAVVVFKHLIGLSEQETATLETPAAGAGGDAARSSTAARAGAPKPVTRQAGARPEPGLLTVEARPPCRVSVDGRNQGPSPVQRLSLAPGRHRVVCAHPELGTREVIAEVRSGAETRTFVLYDGRLQIVARPWAEIEIDGKPIGPTPFPPKALSPGAHKVRARHPDRGYDQTFPVEIEPGKTTVLDISVRN